MSGARQPTRTTGCEWPQCRTDGVNALFLTPLERRWLIQLIANEVDRHTPGIPRIWKTGLLDRIGQLAAHDEEETVVVGQPPESPATTA